VKGGREGRDVDAMQLAQVCEKLGAGEILLNCIDKDGTNSGFDIELVKHISESVSIPVIASFGAGKVEHFSEVFEKTNVEATLASGIFHSKKVPIEAVKEHMRDEGIETR
jgi:glutamine amidotransferase/cyclase